MENNFKLKEDFNEKDFLSESKRFQQIMEYIQVGDSLLTDDEADPNVDPNAPQEPVGTDAMGGGQDPAMGGGPDMDMDPSMAGPNAMDGQAPAQEPSEAPAGPEGFNPQPDAAQETPDAIPMGPEQPGPEDNVIEIDDLTAAQDEVASKVDGLDNKFAQLLNTIDKFMKTVEANDEKISALKQEIEKRNPTPVEKLDLRTVNSSFPYNVKPTDYWEEKEKNSNYRVGGDKEEVPQQYELHQSDIDDTTDWKAVSDSLDDDDFLTNLTKILNY